MSNVKAKIGLFVDRLVREAMVESGLTWDEAVAAFGLAAKGTAIAAAKSGDGSTEDCVAHARKRFEEAFAQPVQVILAGADMEALRAAYSEGAAEMRSLMENSNIRIFRFQQH